MATHDSYSWRVHNTRLSLSKHAYPNYSRNMCIRTTAINHAAAEFSTAPTIMRSSMHPQYVQDFSHRSAKRVLINFFSLHCTRNFAVSESRFCGIMHKATLPSYLNSYASAAPFFLERNILARTTLICRTPTDRAAQVMLLFQSLLNVMHGYRKCPTAK
jgi:hypothetical protein